uniref:HNH nuclease domain-containing protein n=1 Tax=viral metagenome TaxID=1070528 RepID=A0A6C0HXY6_9ZZZZ
MKELTIENTLLRVYENGEVERLFKSGLWKLVNNSSNHSQGYNVILIQKRQYMRSRIMAMTYLNLDVNKKILMHHKDGNRLNCALSNLTIESHQSIRHK